MTTSEFVENVHEYSLPDWVITILSNESDGDLVMDTEGRGVVGLEVVSKRLLDTHILLAYTHFPIPLFSHKFLFLENSSHL